MMVIEQISDKESTSEKGVSPACVGLASSVLPEAPAIDSAESSDTGVSTNYIQTASLPPASHSSSSQSQPEASSAPEASSPPTGLHWYALRTTYGREQKAYDYLVAKGITAFYPTVRRIKEVRGQRKLVVESRIPNIFFAQATEEEMQRYVYDNVNLPYLRFYYRHYHEGSRITKVPLIVPDREMESLKIICEAEADDILMVPEEVTKFRTGQLVRVTEGKFKGVIGRVARYQGQQRVAVTIEESLTIATAYLPSAFLQYIDEI